MSNELYLECYSGISGDMTAAALLDLGADEKVLAEALGSLPIQGFQTKIKRVVKSGIDACDFDVILDKKHENHDHDMEYLHGRSHDQEHMHEEHTGHHHEHRGLREIRQIIEASQITPRAKELSCKIFEILAQAEAKAHHVPVNEVHFHEVGAVDSIVDIVSVAVCMDNLNITKVIIPELHEGKGTIRCQHGILPVPVPAVTNILQEYGLDITVTDTYGELITPTGAAIAAATRTSSELPESFAIRRIGIGAGKRQYQCPGILRAMLIEEENEKKDTIYKLESNIDDCTGEVLGYLMEELFQAGARDVHYIPVFMKKNRPAWVLSVICKEEKVEELENIIFRETTTIGIRRQKMERTILKREQKEIQTSIGAAEVKVCESQGQKHYYPEYESVSALAKKHHLPYAEVYRIVEQESRMAEKSK